jgi:hypothetical protein
MKSEIFGSIMDYMKTLHKHFPSDTNENNKIPVRTAGFPAKIQTMYHPNTTANLFGRNHLVSELY